MNSANTAPPFQAVLTPPTVPPNFFDLLSSSPGHPSADVSSAAPLLYGSDDTLSAEPTNYTTFDTATISFAANPTVPASTELQAISGIDATPRSLLPAFTVSQNNHNLLPTSASQASPRDKEAELLVAFRNLHSAYQSKCQENLDLEKANAALSRDVAYLTSLSQWLPVIQQTTSEIVRPRSAQSLPDDLQTSAQWQDSHTMDGPLTVSNASTAQSTNVGTPVQSVHSARTIPGLPIPGVPISVPFKGYKTNDGARFASGLARAKKPDGVRSQPYSLLSRAEYYERQSPTSFRWKTNLN